MAIPLWVNPGSAGGAGDAEIHQIGEVVVGDQDVFRLDVAVRDAAGMRGVQRGGDLAHDGNCPRPDSADRSSQHAWTNECLRSSASRRRTGRRCRRSRGSARCAVRSAAPRCRPRVASARETSSRRRIAARSASAPPSGACGCPRPDKPRPCRRGPVAASADRAQIETPPANPTSIVHRSTLLSDFSELRNRIDRRRKFRLERVRQRNRSVLVQTDLGPDRSRPA